MAPEIVRHNGEEEYTERVDCFSFGMFLYELVALRPPFEGSDCVKDHILDGGRPMLSHRVSDEFVMRKPIVLVYFIVVTAMKCYLFSLLQLRSSVFMISIYY